MFKCFLVGLFFFLPSIQSNASQTTFPISHKAADKFTNTGCNTSEDVGFYYPEMLCDRRLNFTEMDTKFDLWNVFNNTDKDSTITALRNLDQENIYTGLFKHLIIRDRMGYILDKSQQDVNKSNVVETEIVVGIVKQLDTISNDYIKPIVAVASTITNISVDSWHEGDIANTIAIFNGAENNKNLWLSSGTNRVLSNYPKLAEYTQSFDEYKSLSSTFKTDLTEITKAYGTDLSVKKLITSLELKNIKTSKELLVKINRADDFWDLALDEALKNNTDFNDIKNFFQQGENYDGLEEHIESIKIQLKTVKQQINQLKEATNDTAKNTLLAKVKSHVKNLTTGDIANANARRLKKLSERLGPAISGLSLLAKFGFIIADKQESNYLSKYEALQDFKTIFASDEIIVTAINNNINYLNEIQGVSWSDASTFSYFTDNAGAIKTKVFDEIGEDLYNNLIKGGADVVFDIATPLLTSFGVISNTVGNRISIAGFLLSNSFKLFEIATADDQFLATGARAIAAHKLAYLMWQHSQTITEQKEQIQKELYAHLFVGYGYDQLYNAYYWIPGLNTGMSSGEVKFNVYSSVVGSALSGASVAGPYGALGAVAVDLTHKYSSVFSILAQGMDTNFGIDNYINDYNKHQSMYGLLRAKQITKSNGIEQHSPVINLQKLPVVVKHIPNTNYVAIHISAKDLYQQISFTDPNINKNEYFGTNLDKEELKQSEYRQITASILHNESNLDVKIDTAEARDTTLPQVDLLYYDTGCDHLNICDLKDRHPEGEQRYRVSQPLTDIILYIKKDNYFNADEEKTSLYEQLRLQLRLRNAKAIGSITAEIPLVDLIKNATTVSEKLMQPEILDVDSIFKHNLDPKTAIPLAGIYLSNALPDKNSEHNIRVGKGDKGNKAWSIIRINPLHPTIVEIYYGTDASNYNTERINTITGLNDKGEQAVTHHILQYVANQSLTEKVYAVYDSTIGNFSEFIGPNDMAYRHDLIGELYTGRGSIKDYIQKRIAKIYQARGNSFSESQVTYAVAENLSGFLSHNTYDDDGRIMDYMMQISLPEGEGRAVLTANEVSSPYAHYVFTAQTGDKVMIKYLLGSSAEKSTAQCWNNDSAYYYGDPIEKEVVKLRNAETDILTIVDATISEDCTSISFAVPSTGTWYLSAYGPLVSANGQGSVARDGTSTFPFTNYILAGVVETTIDDTETLASDFILPCKNCGHSGDYDRTWHGDNTTHLAQDYPAYVGDSIVAISNGTITKILTNAAGFGGSEPSLPGGAMVIKHTKSNGENFYALYGHVNNTFTLQVNDAVAAGQIIGTVGDYLVGTDNGQENWPHLHFGIWDSTEDFPASNLGYGTDRSFVDPVPFLQNTKAQNNDDATPITPDTHPLNDTGFTTCINETNSGLPCEVRDDPGKDAKSGRDALAEKGKLQKVGAGHAGFDFTKLDSNGNVLSDSATEWSCVRDNVTMLVWEVKSSDGSLRDKNNTYYWYNSDPNTNLGSPGISDSYRESRCLGIEVCETEQYTSAVNTIKLCGFNDWRVPKIEEYHSIVDYGIPAPGLMIDVNYFSNSMPELYWTSSQTSEQIYRLHPINFNNSVSYSGGVSPTHKLHVRLVRK